MSEPTPAANHSDVRDLQRVLEETLASCAGSSEPERTESLVQALRGPVTALPASSRATVLAMLDALYAEPAASPTSTRVRELETENARLRNALAAAPAAPAPAARLDDLGVAIARLLLASDRDPTALLARDAGAEQRIVDVTKIVVGFVSEIARSFLGATIDAEHTMAGRLNSVIADEIEGRVPPGSVATMIGQIRSQIGSLVAAFREACESGVRDLLRQLAPSALAAGSVQGGVRVLGSRPFYYRECWESFERKHDQLRTADNLYEAFFDGAFRKALHRATRKPTDAGRGTK